MVDLGEYVTGALKRGYSKQEITKILADKGYSQREIASAFNSLEDNNQIEIKESERSYIDRIGLIFSSPAKFFEENREPGIKNALILFIITGLVISALGVGLGYLGSAVFGRFFLFNLSSYLFGGIGIFTVVYLIIFLGVKIAFTFIYSGIVHFTIKQMGGKGRFVDTYNACTYSLIPMVILSIIPIVGLLSFIYSIVLMSIGLSEYHGVSKTKSAISAIIPIAVIILLIIALVLFVLFSFRSIF